MSPIKITIKKKDHRFKWVQTQIEAFEKSLRERHRGVVATLLSALKPFQVKRGLDDPNKPLELDLPKLDLPALEAQWIESMNPLTKSIVEEYTGKMYGFGELLAQRGEEGLYKPPTAKEVERHVYRDGFVVSRALQISALRTFEDIRTKDQSTFSVFRQNLLGGLFNGDSPNRIGQKTAAMLEDKRSDWIRIARTETADVLQHGIYQSANSMGAKYAYVPKNTSACEHCQRLLHGRVFLLSDLQGASNVGEKTANWVPAIPTHPHCTCVAVPASQWTVEQAKAAYEGDTFPKEGVPIEYLPPSERKV